MWFSIHKLVIQIKGKEKVNLYKLRKGDLIVSGDNAGIVTKTTKGYIYYFFRGQECRTSKQGVWKAIDNNSDVDIKYCNMKRRRKKRTNRSLDLHGVSHAVAKEKIRSFLNFVELPCDIITGNSEKMKQIVYSILEEYDWSVSALYSSTDGRIRVVEE